MEALYALFRRMGLEVVSNKDLNHFPLTHEFDRFEGDKIRYKDVGETSYALSRKKTTPSSFILEPGLSAKRLHHLLLDLVSVFIRMKQMNPGFDLSDYYHIQGDSVFFNFFVFAFIRCVGGEFKPANCIVYVSRKRDPKAHIQFGAHAFRKPRFVVPWFHRALEPEYKDVIFSTEEIKAIVERMSGWREPALGPPPQSLFYHRNPSRLFEFARAACGKIPDCMLVLVVPLRDGTVVPLRYDFIDFVWGDIRAGTVPVQPREQNLDILLALLMSAYVDFPCDDIPAGAFTVMGITYRHD